MNQVKRSDRGSTTLLGLMLAGGLVLGSWILGSQIKAIRLGDRYVTVRGLAERNVKADLAIWTLNYEEVGDDLQSLYSKSESDTNVILQFLGSNTIQSSEIDVGIASVADTQANQYGNANHAHRYIVQQSVTVTTTQVDRAAAAARKAVHLLQKGVVIGGDGQQAAIAFRFTGLNTIKPDMISEATRNARAAAERFAQDAGSKVGTIRQATQGVFSISAANAGGAAGESGEPMYGATDENSIMKKVRVVTSVEFYLER